MMMMMMMSYMCGCWWWWWSYWSSAFRDDAFLSIYDCKSQQARCDYILLWLFRTRALHNWQVSSSIVDAVTWSRSVWAGFRQQFYLSRECKKKYYCAAPDATFHCWVALHWASTVAKYHEKNLNMDVGLTAHPARKRLARFLNSQSIFATHMARHMTACATQNYTIGHPVTDWDKIRHQILSQTRATKATMGRHISHSLPCNICTTTIGFGLKRAVPLGICLEHVGTLLGFFTKTFTTISFKVVFPCPYGTVLRLNLDLPNPGTMSEVRSWLCFGRERWIIANAEMYWLYWNEQSGHRSRKKRQGLALKILQKSTNIPEKTVHANLEKNIDFIFQISVGMPRNAEIDEILNSLNMFTYWKVRRYLYPKSKARKKMSRMRYVFCSRFISDHEMYLQECLQKNMCIMWSSWFWNRMVCNSPSNICPPNNPWHKRKTHQWTKTFFPQRFCTTTGFERSVHAFKYQNAWHVNHSRTWNEFKYQHLFFHCALRRAKPGKKNNVWLPPLKKNATTTLQVRRQEGCKCRFVMKRSWDPGHGPYPFCPRQKTKTIL